MIELKHLRQIDIEAISSAARRLSANHPPSALGITLEHGLAKLEESKSERLALENVIRSLSWDARFELIALIWFGRGDSPEPFTELVAEARREHDEHEVVEYIASKSSALPIYLRKGMERLNSN